MTQIVEIWQPSNNINIDYANYQATVNESVNYNWSGTHVFSLSNAIQITGAPNPSLNPTANSLILGVNYDNDGLADIITSDINGFGFYVYEDISGNKSYSPVLKATDSSLDVMSGTIFLPQSANSIYYEPNGSGNFPLQVIFGEANFIEFQFFDASALKHVPLQINYNNNYEVMTLNNTMDDGINGHILAKGSIFLNGNSTDLFSTANTWTAEQTFDGIRGYGSVSFGQSDEAVMGIDKYGKTAPFGLRLGFWKKGGNSPYIGTASGQPIVFVESSQSDLNDGNIVNASFNKLWTMKTNGALVGQRNTVDNGSGGSDWSGLATFNGGITGTGNTGALIAGTGILGTANTWTAKQTFNTVTNFVYNSQASFPVGGGTYLQWNFTGGQGETDIVNNHSTAPNSSKGFGGFTFYDNTDGTSYSQIFRLDEMGYGTFAGGLYTKNNTLDDGSGNVDIAGTYTGKFNTYYDTTDYRGPVSVSTLIGAASVGSSNYLLNSTGRNLLVVYNAYGGSLPTTSGTVYWNHSTNNTGMCLIGDGAELSSTSNVSYFWMAL